MGRDKENNHEIQRKLLRLKAGEKILTSAQGVNLYCQPHFLHCRIHRQEGRYCQRLRVGVGVGGWVRPGSSSAVKSGNGSGRTGPYRPKESRKER